MLRSEVALIHKLILVGLGGFAGAALRYIVSTAVNRGLPNALLPFGTLAVNLLGCFAIGFLAGYVEARSVWSQATRLVVFTGCLGGFTTYSTFGLESFQLIEKGYLQASLVYVGLQVCMGLVAVWLGSLCWR